ncbi:MAG: HAMP domain-containing histidine kinase [Bauldia sp.]|nr:HAMP domain-containing histidine kinase [Bauldia sp.]
MASQVLIYVPAIANFRISWLGDRLATASAASIVLTASDVMEVPRAIQDQLLAQVGADAIAIRQGGISRLIASSSTMPSQIDQFTDLRQPSVLGNIRDALQTLFFGGDRMLRVVDTTPAGGELELIMVDDDLRAAMLAYSVNSIWVTLILSALTGALVFIALQRMFVRPMRRMSQNMVTFTAAPEDASRIIRPSRRTDEFGVAEERLATMETDLRNTLQQQRRLAELGLAVSKISHDLRNMLASAQLFSDRISALPDPAVQRFAPKLIAALDRAINFAQATLTYGKPLEAAPDRRLVRLGVVVEEVAQVLNLENHPAIAWENHVPPSLEVDADPDHLFRVLMNLCRNAIEAMEGSGDLALIRRLTVDARRAGGVVTIEVRDTGPGVPAMAREHLFQPFQGSAKPGGTGLGLAISAELIRAHGGEIDLVPAAGAGSIFRMTIPDRPIDFAARTGRAGAA